MKGDFPFQIKTINVSSDDQGQSKWQCPSNIAIVKYWGKHGWQLPRNASISLTLSNAHTTTEVHYTYSDGLQIDFKFEGKENKPFAEKIEKFLNSVMEYFPWLDNVALNISSENSFPHSSGIASSASAMSALSMCILDIERQLTGENIDIQKASFLSRIGSGSASRSVISEIGMWGKHPSIERSSDLYAIGLDDIHPVFKNFHDDILIVSESEKSVSSTAGHGLMDGNVYAQARYDQANQRVKELISILKTGDVDAFGKLAEDEAMTLHALMMCSDPSYILMKPATISIIEEIRTYRERTGAPIFFTLDAGPNIHLLYPDSTVEQAHDLIENHLKQFTINSKIIKDYVGKGPKNMA